MNSFLPARRTSYDAATHWTYLGVALLAVIGPFFLSCSTERDGAMLLAQWRLPPSCVSKTLFHAECPGCGLTHAFVQLVHGELRASLHSHRMGILLYAFFLSQVIYRIYALRRPAQSQAPLVQDAQHFVGMAMVLALLGNWVLGLYLGSNGS